MADNLFEILEQARRELGDTISDAAWARFKLAISRQAGGERTYVPAQKKRSHLEVIADLGDHAAAQKLALALGVSVRRAQQLKKLRRD